MKTKQDPWKFHVFFFITPGNSTSLLVDSQEFPYALFSTPLEIRNLFFACFIHLILSLLHYKIRWRYVAASNNHVLRSQLKDIPFHWVNFIFQVSVALLGTVFATITCFNQYNNLTSIISYNNLIKKKPDNL